MSKTTVYFAHGTRKHGTTEEAEVLTFLAKRFPDRTIVNPAKRQPRMYYRVTKEVKAFLKTDYCGTTCTSRTCKIDYFLEMVKNSSVFVKWADGASCGVRCEERFARSLGKRMLKIETQYVLRSLV